jgi:phosphopentomutase
MALTRDLLRHTNQPGLIFTNLVDFDTSYGHMRDVDGYARHLHWFDGAVRELMDDLVPGDRLVITADHGNDPTWEGSDHTRERVPCVVYGVDLAEPGSYGSAPMAALGVAVCEYLRVSTVGLDEATGITL